ncbi:MAG: TolC family protein [Gemmatimonadota bacterium]|nr:TolC family protein [Gemmatimonadota bacterium]
MRISRWGLGLGLACTLLTTDALAQEPIPERLSLDEALEIARRNSPAYQRARNDESLADWNVRQAYGGLLPSASVGGQVSWQGPGEQQLGNLTTGDLGFTNQPSYYFSSYNLGVNYSLDWATIREPERARADRKTTRARIDVAATDLTAAVTSAYVDMLRQVELHRTAEQQLENSRINLRLAEGQLEVGTVTPIDVGQAEIQVGRSEVQVLQAANAVETARMRLLQRMGVRVHQPVEPVTRFTLYEPRWSLDSLRSLAVERNPDLRATRAAREAADLGVSAARSPYLPTLSISTGWGGFAREASDPDFLVSQARTRVASNIASCVRTNEIYSRLADPLPTTDCSQLAFTDDQRRAIIESNDQFPFGFQRSSPSISLGISIPIFQGLSRQRNLEAARVQRDDLVHEARELELALEADLRIALAEVRTAYESALLEERNRELAERQLTLARERYQVGAITFVELMDAQTVLSGAESDSIVAAFAYHDAVTALEALVGASLRD